jgi:cytochrome oxidase Cu insertion factor (SCO1/SenC/PrrC family)
MNAWLKFAILASAGLAAGGAAAQVSVGQAAPAFAVTDTQGRSVKLADFKGKHVVLEWVNPGCPYVQKHYNSGNLPATQKAARAKDVVWLAINSTAVDHYDYRKPDDLSAWLKSKDSAMTATLMDADGRVGRAYGARTTPHLYLIDPQGKLLYAGAIDSIPSANVADIKTATNYVNQALGEALAGKTLSKPTSQAYGCSVKYANAG